MGLGMRARCMLKAGLEALVAPGLLCSLLSPTEAGRLLALPPSAEGVRAVPDLGEAAPEDHLRPETELHPQDLSAHGLQAPERRKGALAGFELFKDLRCFREPRVVSGGECAGRARAFPCYASRRGLSGGSFFRGWRPASLLMGRCRKFLESGGQHIEEGKAQRSKSVKDAISLVEQRYLAEAEKSESQCTTGNWMEAFFADYKPEEMHHIGELDPGNAKSYHPKKDFAKTRGPPPRASMGG
mgnify:CR=1 FL=1